MNVTITLAVVIVGFAVGLRTFTAPAVIAGAAYFGCIDMGPTPLAFMSSPIAAAILSVAALGEYIFDLLPKTPPRTAAVGLIARFVSGSFSAACLFAAVGQTLTFCLIGGFVAIGGAFAGYQIRTRLVRALGVKDALIAIPEDVVAIVISLAAICIIR